MNRSRPRTPATLSESIHRQLNMYAFAAGAAGVSVLALTQSAEAKIIYTQTHVVIGTNHIYELDLNHDGIADFKIGSRIEHSRRESRDRYQLVAGCGRSVPEC
jgi:hypothetical protein